MLKIKLSINATSINANGLFIDARGNKCSINKSFSCEEKAMNELQSMINRDCEFSLVIIRSV